MKTLAVLLLLSAFAAVFATEAVFHRAVFDFLDQRHEEKMAQVVRDQGLSEDTLVARGHPKPPGWMKPCIIRGIVCWKKSSHNACAKLCCIDQFFECLRYEKPDDVDIKLTPLQKGCVALLAMCRAHSPSCAGKLCCFVRVKRCFELHE